MPKIKSEIGKSRVHIKAATLGGVATQQPLDFTKLTKQVSWADEKPVSPPRVKIDKSQINYKNPFGDLLIDSSVLQAQVGVYDKLKAEEATADAEQKKQQQTVESTKQLPRPNKKQRRLQKRSDFHKKLQQEKEERRKPKQKKVCLKEFKTMRSALSEVVVSSKPSDDEMPSYSPSMDTFFSTSSGQVTSSGGSGKVKKNRKKKSEHLLQQNNIRSVPKFLRKKRVQKSFDDIMCFQQAIKQCTTADEHLLLKNIKK